MEYNRSKMLEIVKKLVDSTLKEIYFKTSEYSSKLNTSKLGIIETFPEMVIFETDVGFFRLNYKDYVPHMECNAFNITFLDKSAPYQNLENYSKEFLWKDYIGEKIQDIKIIEIVEKWWNKKKVNLPLGIELKFINGKKLYFISMSLEKLSNDVFELIMSDDLLIILGEETYKRHREHNMLLQKAIHIESSK